MTDVTQGDQQQANGAAAANAAQASGQQGQQAQQNGQAQNGSAQNGQAQSGQANGAQNGAQANASGTLASGAQSQEQDVKPYWPADWREKVAAHFSAGDKSKYQQELDRLQTTADPTVLWSRFREMENIWAKRGFIKAPPKENPTEKDIKEFHKELGVPDEPAGYLKDVKLDNGLVLGEADKPIAEAFAAVAHKAGVPPAGFNAALNWYLSTQEKQVAELDERDEKFRMDSERALKDEFGPSYKRKTNAISTLFDVAAGGADIKNEKALYSRLMGGRMADGTLIGNDPDMVKFLVALAMDRNPAASVVEDGDQTGSSINNEIEKIEKIMREDRPLYNKQYANRYAELIAARDKIRARAR